MIQFRVSKDNIEVINSTRLLNLLKERGVKTEEAKIIVNCYEKMHNGDEEYANGVFRLRRRNKAFMNVFISTPFINSFVTVYCVGAYYQVILEEENVHIVYKKFGAWTREIYAHPRFGRIRELMSKDINLKKLKIKIKEQNDK